MHSNLQERLILVTLAAIQFTHVVDFMILMPLGPQLMRVFNINSQQFAILVAAYSLSAGAVGFAGAFFLDRLDRKKAVMGAYIGFALGTFLCSVSPTYATLLIARIITGMFGGLLSGLIMSVIGDVIPFERRGKAMGVVMSGFAAATVFGVPFGLWVGTQYGWNTPFFFLSGAALIILAGIVFCLPKMTAHMTAAENTKIYTNFLDILKNPSQRSALLLISIMMFGQFVMVPFISPYLVANVGFSELQLTLVYLFGGVGTLVASTPIGYLADRFGKPQVFTAAVLLVIGPILILTHLGPSPMWLPLIVSTAMFVLMIARMVPAMALITATASDQNRAGFMSLITSVQQLAAGAGAFIGGAIVVQSATGHFLHYPTVGYIAIVANVIAVFLIRRIKPIQS
ncbi:MFS transporter [bacterium]|jgi:predicted MFS family arabinose efflux permease|nr:MFS transporter [bacterium]